MNKHKLFSAIFTFFTVITLLLVSFIGFLTLTHTKAFTVQSGSMSPAFDKGDAVFVRPVNTADLQADDIITVKSVDGSSYFTHRITRFDAEKTVVYTKGDGNPGEDPMPADITLVAGKVWFSIPYLGILSGAVQSRMFLIIIAVTVTLLVLFRMILTGRKNKDGGGKDAAKQK